jgi:hypothetical protein
MSERTIAEGWSHKVNASVSLVALDGPDYWYAVRWQNRAGEAGERYHDRQQAAEFFARMCAEVHYDRAMARGIKAYQEARKRGENGLEAALTQIRATFDEELRADTLAALKLSASIASGRAPTMEEVADVLRNEAEERATDRALDVVERDFP